MGTCRRHARPLSRAQQTILSQNQGAEEAGEQNRRRGGERERKREPRPRGVGGGPDIRPAHQMAAGRLHFRPAAPGVAVEHPSRLCESRVSRKRLSGRRFIGLACASCFLFYYTRQHGRYLGPRPRLPTIVLHPLLSAAPSPRGRARGPARPQPPRAAGLRAEPRAPAVPGRPFSRPGLCRSPRTPLPSEGCPGSRVTLCSPTRRAASAPKP